MGTTLKLNNKSSDDEELPQELFRRTRQTTKIRNAFANNMSTDRKLSKPKVSKIIQSGGCFGSWLENLGKKARRNPINKFDRKISAKRASKAGKRFPLFISNEDMSGVTKVIKSLEDSGALIDGVTETVKGEIKKQEGGFLGASLAPLTVSLA